MWEWCGVGSSAGEEAVMAKARDIMHVGATCIGEYETLQQAAMLMREQNIGALPICGDDERLHGMITDRDIVVKCLATGGDPTKMTAGELAQGRTFTIDADAEVDEVLTVMEQHKVRRLPVIENHRLVGMISEADLGRHLTEEQIGHFVESISSEP
jgi:CBS domain-containing protein